MSGKQPKKTAYEWVQFGHQQYVAARILYWKGFIYNFALLGAHALEIYLKAFIIHKTSKYSPGHDLEKFYRECMELDDFFCDELLSSHFLPEKIPPSAMPECWPNYLKLLRYPESLQEDFKSPGFGILSGSDSPGTCKSLDQIAFFMYNSVPHDDDKSSFRVNIVEGTTETDVNVIDDLLNGKGYYWSLGTPENSAEIIELFLRHNPLFSTN